MTGEFVYGEGNKKWDKYVGEFKNGMFNGNGTYYSNDGSRYVGGFVDGKKHGRGAMFYRSGESREGTWTKDKLIGR